MTTTQDIGTIATTLGLFASCIKSGEDWSPTCETANREAHDALTRVAQQKSPVSGWQVVPTEPTEAMIEAALHEYATNSPYESPFGQNGSFACQYRAMLAAAPTQPSGQEQMPHPIRCPYCNADPSRGEAHKPECQAVASGEGHHD